MKEAIVYPMVAQGALVFGVLLLLMKRRITAIAARQTKMKYFRLFSGEGEPDAVTVVQRNFINQFEMPLMFFVVCLMAVVFDKVDDVMVYAAWSYVAIRWLHAVVHIAYNNVVTRFHIFMLSNLVLMFMWGWVIF